MATAALEVGFNDPTVGAVLQHKAPRDWASFLQRKGRAGRRREMRPWTAVVLSDFGRDRMTYLAYDQLFDPQLPLRSLPVSNRYVLRMQAVFALMDWIARELRGTTADGGVWTDFSGPRFREDEVRRRQAEEREILEEVLDGNESRFQSLSEYLKQALKLSEDQLISILWEPPRSLMTSVIPEYVPHQLFGELNLPEVEIEIAPQRAAEKPVTHFLPIVQAMKTLAPGAVTRRFGFRHAQARHWTPIKLESGVQRLAIESYLEEFEEAGAFQYEHDGRVETVRCVRPWRIRAAEPDRRVETQSNSQLAWRSQLMESRQDDRLRFTPPAGSGWEQCIAEMRFFTHGERNHVHVRRFALGATATMRLQRQPSFESKVRFVERATGGQAAVGFSQDSDGLLLHFRIPVRLNECISEENGELLQSFRLTWFRHRMRSERTLDGLANSFLRDRLSELTVSAIARTAREKSCDLETAFRQIEGELNAQFSAVLDAIFQSLEDEDGEVVGQKLRETLLDLTARPEVLQAIRNCAACLWSLPDEAARSWLAKRYCATLGGAVLQAAQLSCPQVDAGDLLLDLESGPRPPGHRPAPEGVCEVWITESTVGGGGVIEEVLRTYSEDPSFLTARISSIRASISRPRSAAKHEFASGTISTPTRCSRPLPTTECWFRNPLSKAMPDRRDGTRWGSSGDFSRRVSVSFSGRRRG